LRLTWFFDFSVYRALNSAKRESECGPRHFVVLGGNLHQQLALTLPGQRIRDRA
jgi:hypothetical protein